MKNKNAYMMIGAAILVAAGVLFYYLFSGHRLGHRFNEAPAGRKKEAVKVIEPDNGDSRQGDEGVTGNVGDLHENPSVPGDEMPAPSGGAAEENKVEFEIDVNELRQLFPDNLALPSVTEEERRTKIEARQARNDAYGMIAANKATEAQIHAYYEQQSRLAEDSIEIIEFILDKYGEQLGERERAKQEFLLLQFQKRLAIIPQKEQAALQRLKTN